MEWGLYFTILGQVILAILALSVTVSMAISLIKSTLQSGSSRER